MIAYFAGDSFLGSYDGQNQPLPSYHFFCPSCGEIWARIIAEPGDYHRITDNIWCAACARTNAHGIWDGIICVHFFPEYWDYAPVEVFRYNFLQVYDNRARLDNAKVPIDSSIINWPDNSALLARLKETL